MRVVAVPNLPGPLVQWCVSEPLSAYSCGGSRGIGQSARTAFPFQPPVSGQHHQGDLFHAEAAESSLLQTPEASLSFGLRSYPKERSVDILTSLRPGPQHAGALVPASHLAG